VTVRFDDTPDAVRAVMRGNRRRDTRPERALRSALHRLGYRFRTDFLIREGGARVRPDVVFTRRRVAVFIDGCFWHCCPQHSNSPSVNRGYWGPKLERNVARDDRNNAALEAAGWKVVRIWEHEPLEVGVALVRQALEASLQPG